VRLSGWFFGHPRSIGGKSSQWAMDSDSGLAQGDTLLDSAEKKRCVRSLTDVFKSASVVVVAHYSGLNVAQMQELRKQMRAAGGTVRVAKNRLVKIAVQGTQVALISGLMRGPTLIAY